MFVQLGSIVLVTVLLSSPIAADGRADRNNSVPVASIVTLSAEHDGSMVHLRSGELMQVTLAANFSTGYRWHVEALDETLILHHCNGFVPDLPVMPGSGGTARLFFEAFQPGRTVLRLAYYRPWEDPSTAMQTFQVLLVVH